MKIDETDIYKTYNPEITSDLSDLKESISEDLFRYWDGLRNGRAMPTWDEFSLMDIYKSAPYMLVLDVVRSNEGKTRFQYRFVGTKIVEYWRKRKIADHTGMFADEAPRIYSPSALIELYDRCAKEAVPILSCGRYETETSIGEHERMSLPLGGDDGVVEKLVASVDRLENR